MLICFCSFQVEAVDEQHKIVYLISGPRSLSTVFLRMMESRGDFIVFNEPTIPVYDRIHYKEITKGWFRDDANVTYDDVKQRIFDASNQGNVFVKEMSFSSYDLIVNDQDFITHPSMYFLILVRNPHHTSISFYRNVEDIVPGMSDLIGLQKLWNEYQTIKKVNPDRVRIIFADQLYANPENVMSGVCEYLQIPFTAKAFCWKSHDHQFNGHNSWNEQKVGDHIHHWHGRAIRSTGMGKPSQYLTDAKGTPTFEEIKNIEHRAKMKEAYLENLLYYNKFKKEDRDEPASMQQLSNMSYKRVSTI